MPDTTPARWARYPSVEAKLQALTEATSDGHARWTGPTDGPYPHLKYAGRTWPVRTIAYRLHHGHDPVGTVRTSCDDPQCIAGAHLDDTPTRKAHRAAYRALGL